jgi:putative colanic acid biosynthesis UDP-glucose lipid carrier transferase
MFQRGQDYHFTEAVGSPRDHATPVRLSLKAPAKAANTSISKRSLDIGLAAFLMVILIPAFVLIAVCILADGPGPVFFQQDRYGRGKRVFKIIKFRSMNVCESSGPFSQVQTGDLRVTRVGRFLRRTSIDELPQLYNVLKGDMSLVGPRPHAVPMDELFGGLLSQYCDRHLVRPGMTGLAQVCGCRGPTETLSAISKRVKLDLEYIKKWSIWFDVWILVRTPLSLIRVNAV